ncbi:hypothetical protein F4813DRAFT_272379 [Daldinia decipiens]|uniref:uncharacterized protein n=1 Tax=Daldinia decipiens TaxID=326647 RepID=UPI0020C3B78C|nr:uncharacterized protein F4813DRAFT_272379 [Daldinia decipiens]KAI1661010.1 hypothetical protein F4813DRAFT_272379 [Daldinia decipiens]
MVRHIPRYQSRDVIVLTSFSTYSSFVFFVQDLPSCSRRYDVCVYFGLLVFPILYIPLRHERIKQEIEFYFTTWSDFRLCSKLHFSTFSNFGDGDVDT